MSSARTPSDDPADDPSSDQDPSSEQEQSSEQQPASSDEQPSAPPTEPPPDGATSTTLLDGILVNDPSAWRKLVELYGPLAYRYCCQRGLSAEDAKDVGQEVFQAVLKGIGGFRRNKPGDSFRGWFMTITKNKVIDFFRRNSSRNQAAGGTEAQLFFHSVPFDQHDDPPTNEPESDRICILRRALAMLPDVHDAKTLHAFQLFYNTFFLLRTMSALILIWSEERAEGKN